MTTSPPYSPPYRLPHRLHHRSRPARLLVAIFALVVASLFALPAAAQTIDLEWERWDSQIAVQSDTTMSVAETQTIAVFSGPVRRATRDWDQDVTISRVFFIGADGVPVALSQRSGGAAGTYALSNNGEGTRLEYILPAPVNSGDSFSVQINYEAALPSAGIIDWPLIPPNRGFVVQNSTHRITFPAGQVPTSGLIRVTEGAGTVSVSGNNATVTASGPIASGQALRVQAPFGTGVGAAGNSAGAAPAAATSIPRTLAPAPSGSQNATGGIDLAACLPIIVILLLVFLGGGRGLGGLLGGLGGLGGGGSTPRSGGFGGFPGLGGLGGSGRSSSGSRPSAPSAPSSGSGRGFRQSGRTGRSLPSFRSNKGSGGGAGFG